MATRIKLKTISYSGEILAKSHSGYGYPKCNEKVASSLSGDDADLEEGETCVQNLANSGMRNFGQRYKHRQNITRLLTSVKMH